MKRKLIALALIGAALVAMGVWEGPIQLKRGAGIPSYLLPAELAIGTNASATNAIQIFCGIFPSNVVLVGGSDYASTNYVKVSILGGTNDLWIASTNYFQARLYRIATTQTNYQITDDNDIILANGTNIIDVTLPSAAGVTGRIYSVKNISTYKANVISAGGSIDGAATNILVSKWDAVDFFCLGTNWFRK